jgi:hypothetical protein
LWLLIWLQHQTVLSDLIPHPKLRPVAEYEVTANSEESALVSSAPTIHIVPSAFMTVAPSHAEMQPHDRPAQTNASPQVLPAQHDCPAPPHEHVPLAHESVSLHETPPQQGCETSPHAQMPAGVQERFVSQVSPQQG